MEGSGCTFVDASLGIDNVPKPTGTLALAHCHPLDDVQNKELPCGAPKSKSKNAKRKEKLRNCLSNSVERNTAIIDSPQISRMVPQGNNMLPPMGPHPSSLPLFRPPQGSMPMSMRPQCNNMPPVMGTQHHHPPPMGLQPPRPPLSPMQAGVGYQTAVITKRTVRVSNYTPRGNFVYEHVQNTVSMQNVPLPQSGSHQYYNNMMQHPLLGPAFMNYPPQRQVTPQLLPRSPQPLPIMKPKESKPRENFKFESYLSIEEVQEGLKNNKLTKGVFRINPKQYKVSFVRDDYNQQDIFIDGILNRNRAFDGDIVVVELFDKATIEARRAQLNKAKSNSDSISKTVQNQDSKIDKQLLEKQSHSDVKVAGDEPDNMIEIEDLYKTQRQGKVVYIMEKVHPRRCIGSLKLMPDKNKTMAIFQTRDNRCPNLNIACTSWPDNFYKDYKSYENCLFSAKILDWTDTRFGIGMIESMLGRAGDLKVEQKAILLQNELDDTPFDPKMNRYYPNISYTIPPEEINLRADCRKLCIFAIDPYNCRDIDDALSCTKLENGNYEIGVHISDVSHYLAENTELDTLVAKKATTIYLVERAFHMLPDDLCVLCSLFPGIDKLAFSVFFEMSKDAEILNHRFTKSVIHSCAQLSYEQAQAILDDKIDENDLPDVGNGFTYKDVYKSVKSLGKLSEILRERRFENGALRLGRTKVSIKLNATGLPQSVGLYEIKESHQLIEEFMLLANTTVANKIREDFPYLAYLRCHGPPLKLMMADLVRSLKAININLDATSAGTVNGFIKSLSNEEYGKNVALVMLCSKPMSRAKYYCAGKPLPEGTGHYALNVPLYTHFTSPIRRYSDIMVHRLLAASLKYREAPDWKISQVHDISEVCNKNKFNAKKAYEMSTELYITKYVEMHSPVNRKAVVVEVKEKFLDVIILDMDFLRRIFINNDFPGRSAKCEFLPSQQGKLMGQLTFHWHQVGNLPKVKQTIKLFDVVDIVMIKAKESDKLETKLVRPE